MIDRLLLFEDTIWRGLRPLTDYAPVPGLAFGGSTLATRWRRAAGGRLIGIEARTEPMAAWRDAPTPDMGRLEPDQEVWVANAAALPGSWLSSALAQPTPALFMSGERVAAARLKYASLQPALGRGADLAAALLGLGLPRVPVQVRMIRFPWNLTEWNTEAIAEDLNGIGGAIHGDVDARAILLEPGRITVQADARIDPLAVLDARDGPILIESSAVIAPHTLIIGPCVVGTGTHLLGGVIARSTLGPQCRIAGEVDECVWQGYANKRHHGFVGHSVIGEWVNLGALTTTSDLKNNYGPVRVWVDGREVDSELSKIGSVIGAHVKTGIGTLLPTGCSIGVGSNVFGGGRFAPKHLPAFSWWDGDKLDEHRLPAFVKTARTAMGRRGCSLGAATEAMLGRLFAATAVERRAPDASPLDAMQR